MYSNVCWKNVFLIAHLILSKNYYGNLEIMLSATYQLILEKEQPRICISKRAIYLRYTFWLNIPNKNSQNDVGTTLNLIINIYARLFLLQRLNNVLNHYLILLYTYVFAYILGTSSFIMARIGTF